MYRKRGCRRASTFLPYHLPTRPSPQVVVISVLVLVVVVTLGALVWDCLKRRRSMDDVSLEASP